MCKPLVAWRKRLVLLSVGASAFLFPFMAGGCSQFLQNSDLIGFYQAAGEQSINAFFDPARNLFGPNSDWAAIVVNPTVNVLETVWDHWVWSQFPKDPVPNFE